MEKNNNITQFKTYVESNRPDMTINRLPEPCLSQFKQFAFDNFKGKKDSGDYGMALKFLYDYYQNDTRITSIETRLDNIEMVIKNE